MSFKIIFQSFSVPLFCGLNPLIDVLKGLRNHDIILLAASKTDGISTLYASDSGDEVEIYKHLPDSRVCKPNEHCHSRVRQRVLC